MTRTARPITVGPDGGTNGLPSRLGLLGGTFDPPHMGHLISAVWVRSALDLDEVRLVVANRPWQKVADRTITPVEHRWSMVSAAVEGIEGVVACDTEIERGGDSYTIDTVAAVIAQDPGTTVFVIMGTDAAAGLETWHRSVELREMITVAVMERPGIDAGPLPDRWSTVNVAVPRVDLTSTELRRRVGQGLPIDAMVPRAVGSLIRSLGLYRGAFV